MPRQLHREKDVQMYETEGNQRSPAPSMPSNSKESRPMDEISLLKKGLLTKGGCQHNLRSGKPFHEISTPISLQELTTRGLLLEDGKTIIYGLSGQQGLKPVHELRLSTSPSSSTLRTTSSGTSRVSNVTSVYSRQTLIEPLLRESVYNVGLSEEKATLLVGDTEHGKRYELTIGSDFQLELFDSTKASALIIFKGL